MNNFTYKQCGVLVNSKQMRKHVGVHILKDGLRNSCGFCGLVGCTIDLVNGSGRGKTTTLTAGGNCRYRVKFSLKSAEKSTKSGPCTNRPISCKICKSIYWSYNLAQHFKERHSDYPTPKIVEDVEYIHMGLNVVVILMV